MNILDDTLRRTENDQGTTSICRWEDGHAFAPNPGSPIIEVTEEKSQDAALRHRGKRVTVLNFASGVSPGGGVRYGYRAQEEDLCLCSGLLYGLEDNIPYYNANRAVDAPPACFDAMIVSDQVPLIKDGSYNLVPVQHIRVFTYSAPILGSYGIDSTGAAEVFNRRAPQIVQKASELGTDVLILGAWGCGAYGNNPYTVASSFKAALAKQGGGIGTAVFPVYGDTANYLAFLETFQN